VKLKVPLKERSRHIVESQLEKRARTASARITKDVSRDTVARVRQRGEAPSDAFKRLQTPSCVSSTGQAKASQKPK
jgi:hypothetical protein